MIGTNRLTTIAQFHPQSDQPAMPVEQGGVFGLSQLGPVQFAGGEGFDGLWIGNQQVRSVDRLPVVSGELGQSASGNRRTQLGLVIGKKLEGPARAPFLSLE